jgi:pimeloyl-ACP methyl ester carboxylesterase
MKRKPIVGAADLVLFMKYLLWIAVASCGGAPHTPVVADACAPSLLSIGGDQIWVNRQGAGTITVAFEAGFGNDSSVWATIAPKIRAAGVQTFVYDRAGMGKSTLDAAARYSFDNDVTILRTALTRCGIAGPIVMIGHSYGGAMSLLAATVDDRIRGVVLIDSMVPKAWPQSELDKNLKVMRAQYDEIREKEPGLAKVAIPWAEALPATLQRLDSLVVSDNLPVIDIVAEKGPDDPESARLMRDAHDRFTANHAHREHVLAVGSSHKVMVDKPDVVVDAILKMIAMTKSLD